MIFILGGNGFVGSAYARLLKERNLEFTVISRENYGLHVGEHCDVLINANGNSRKYLADQDPRLEFDASVRTVTHALEDFKADFVIHLSTGDVYPDQSAPDRTCEDQSIDVSRLSRYGLHKFLAENLVRGVSSRHIIMRMGGFVGPGMKKNAIFDMMNGAPVWLTRESELQFIHTDTAARLVWGLYEKGVVNEVINLGAMGVTRVGDIHQLVSSTSEFRSDARHVRFELNTEKLAVLTGEMLPRTEYEVRNFLASDVK